MYQPSQFVAHRGYARHYPENTLTAITAAINAGAVCVEIDIQFSKDGVPMLYHDVSLQRVSGLRGKLFDFTAAELEAMPASEPKRFGQRFADVPISTAAEFALLVTVKSQVHFYVELKEESTARFGAGFCLAALQPLFAGLMPRITLISDDFDAVLLAKQRYGFTSTGIVFRDWARRDTLITTYQADIAYINILRIPPADQIQAACPIAVYEIDDPLFAAETLNRGAAKVESYAIGELIEALC